MKTSTFCAVSVLFTLCAGPALGQPTELSLHELDRTTAGQDRPPPNGGSIVGNNSSANLTSSGEVTISDGAQAESRALNMVNSSESTVANGVNVFDGRVNGTAALEKIDFNIAQQNEVVQDQRRLASLPAYQRGANTDTSSADSGSMTHSSSRSELDRIIDLERSTLLEKSTIDEGSFTKSSAPTVRLDFQLGEFLSYEAELNVPSASNSLGGAFNGGYTLDIPPATATLETTLDDGKIPVSFKLESPSLALEFDAMGCIAVNGSCTIKGSREQLDETVSDHSTLYTLDETEDTTKTWDRTSTETVRAPFELSDAQAEYIVVDESEIDVSASYLVSLSGGAQAGLRAMNVVNASGSAVANGVNVAVQRTGGDLESAGPRYRLTQSNTIIHSR